MDLASQYQEVDLDPSCFKSQSLPKTLANMYAGEKAK